jgi:hypothetical protein
MIIKVVGLQRIPEYKQQLVGQWILQVIHYANVRVDGVTVKFEEEKDEEMDEQKMEPKLYNDHDMRQMRYDNEQLGLQIKELQKANGRLSAQIHVLRCELAEVREINGKIARNHVRELERQRANDTQTLTQLRATNQRRFERNRELREKLAAKESLTGSDV